MSEIKNPLSFYQSEKRRLEQIGNTLKSQLKLIGLLRTGLFLILLISSYYLIERTLILLTVIGPGSVLFLMLVLKYQKLQKKRKLSLHLLNINLEEIEILQGEFHHFPSGIEFSDPRHYYSNDIDLFGQGSFFQFMNRTATRSGTSKLASLLLENKVEQIKQKQFVVQELAQKVSWRQHFLAKARMVKNETNPEDIISWIKNHKRFLPGFMKYLTLIFSSLSLIFVILTALSPDFFYLLVIWFFAGLLITLPYFKRINTLYEASGKIKNTFKQYESLLSQIESVELNAVLAREQQNRIHSTDKKASEIFKEFSQILDAFDQRNNMLFGILGNGFLLWDIKNTNRIDSWISKYRHQVDQWFEVIAYFDSQISLSNYVFNHPDHNFSSIVDTNQILKARELGHPLISRDQRVSNDYEINDKEFHIITGANMAGKSTFLRTVSLALVMTNVGLPVCAKRMAYSPIKLITSMRTSDSLKDDDSYFYAEIKRLRFIVESMKKESYFVILDEILKGTNSKDKALGSIKFVEILVHSGSSGIIATHDLSLCEIEKKFDQVQNKYFDAEIRNKELFFDYKLKDGVCKNMNASFLLKKMEII
ncbi:DNA mismatch repair protein MutS [Lutimonas saemankumensis]|uniref:MutS-related protein n=1 Tax=Lutimonas saemankumensis TaxID=483016 RepID=UPI001CD1C1D0|nr:DNA mismatch repair protein MutS [Lutimonas saemankumensis]MCA0932833.1 DNA mismatch repair protein MutS [Lutimonas saemankumensis]